MIDKTLEKLNKNLQIALASNNSEAVTVITEHINSFNNNTYIPESRERIRSKNKVALLDRNINVEKELEKCVHRGKLLYEKSCKCKNGRVWECNILGKVIERLCNSQKCKGFSSNQLETEKGENSGT